MNENDYPCVGVCMADPDSGFCLGCGRPPCGDPVSRATQNARTGGAAAPSVTAPDAIEPSADSGAS